jgi:hypothetical protein
MTSCSVLLHWRAIFEHFGCHTLLCGLHHRLLQRLVSMMDLVELFNILLRARASVCGSCLHNSVDKVRVALGLQASATFSNCVMAWSKSGSALRA